MTDTVYWNSCMP